MGAYAAYAGNETFLQHYPVNPSLVQNSALASVGVAASSNQDPALPSGVALDDTGATFSDVAQGHPGNVQTLHHGDASSDESERGQSGPASSAKSPVIVSGGEQPSAYQHSEYFAPGNEPSGIVSGGVQPSSDQHSKQFAGNNQSSASSGENSDREFSDEDQRDSALRSDEQHVSQSSSSTQIKYMKSASKCIQFYTTIVCLVCCNVREFGGFSGTTARAIKIFKFVEAGLRDRTLYPLPEDVSLKELLSMSYFKGLDAESEWSRYCQPNVALTGPMIQFAERLYVHKFTDIKRTLINVVIPSYCAIVDKLNGFGKKSG